MKCGIGDRRASSNALAARFVVVWNRGHIRYAPVDVCVLYMLFACVLHVFYVLNGLEYILRY